jgi:exodeoxyribonuclease X
MKYLILDTETTGLHAPQACEIAYFPVSDSFSIFKSNLKSAFDFNFGLKDDFTFETHFDFIFNSRFKPNKKIDPQAAKVTGITDEHVKDCPSIDTFSLPEETICIIGHNITYDHKVLSYKDLANPVNVKLICTKELSQLAFQGLNIENNKLTTLFQHFYPEHTDILENAHGAYQDCLMVYMLLYQILERLPKVDSWEKLISLCSQGKKTYEQLSELNNVMETIPFGKHKGKKFSEIPKNYLEWLLKQGGHSPSLENAIKLQLLK